MTATSMEASELNLFGCLVKRQLFDVNSSDEH